MNGINNLEVNIRDSYDTYQTEIWLIDRGQEFDSNITINSDGFLLSTKIEYGGFDQDLKPFLKLPKPFADNLFRKISEYLHEKGIKPKDVNLLEGKLQATESHLKDMQEVSKILLNHFTK